MHYDAYVLIPGNGDVDQLVAEALRPYDEALPVEQLIDCGETYWHNPHGCWDYYQIGRLGSPRRKRDIRDAARAVERLTEAGLPYSFIVHGSESVAHAEWWGRPDVTRDRMLALIRRTVEARRAAGYRRDRLVYVSYHR